MSSKTEQSAARVVDLDQWCFLHPPTMGPHFIGRVRGHATIADGTLVRTANVVGRVPAKELLVVTETGSVYRLGPKRHFQNKHREFGEFFAGLPEAET